MYSPQINYNFDAIYNYNRPQPTTPVLYPHITPQQSYYVPVAPKPVLTQSIHNQTLQLLSKAAGMSSSILYRNVQNPPPYNPQYLAPQPVAPKVTPTTYNFDFSDRSWNMFNSQTHVHHHHHHGKENENKDDTGTRILVGLIGLAIAGTAAFFIGKAVAQGEDIEEENQSVEDLKIRWNINKVCYEGDYQASVEGLISRMDVLAQRNQTHRIHKIALLALTFIGGGTAVAGAVIGSSALIATAAAVGAVVTVAALFKLGYTCFSTRDQKDAEAIETKLSEISYMDPAVVI